MFLLLVGFVIVTDEEDSGGRGENMKLLNSIYFLLFYIF